MKKKWLVLGAGVALQLILGGVYAWSAFVPSLTRQHGLSNAQCGVIFGVVIAVFTIVMIPSGRLLRRFGPRVVAGAGACLFAAGYVAASHSRGSFPGLLVGIGVLTGAGIGAGYVCPLTVAMKWFPNNKGLVTGVAVAGFGSGAVVLSFLAQFLLQTAQFDVLQVFRIIGIGFGAVALVAALMLSEPDQTTGNDGERRKVAEGLMSYVLSGKFGFLFLGLFAATFAGLLTVGNLKPILLGAGLDPTATTLGIALFAVGNGAGRVIWGQIHDRVGSRRTVLFSLGFLGVALIPLLFDLPAVSMLGLVPAIGIGFGAAFVVYALAMVEHFGVDLFPRLYPLCFLGYGLAGIIGPGTGGWIKDATGSFVPAIGLSVSAVLLACGLFAVALPARKDIVVEASA
jgi:OFA family oxalate/formate antiporter-like MFS transporter